MGKGSGKGAGKGGDNWNAGGVGVAIDLEAFKAEVDALGAKLKAEQGDADRAHFEKIRRWTQLFGLLGIVTMGMNPLYLFPAVLYSLAVTARWTMIGHHTCHGGYDWMDDTRFRRSKYGLGSMMRRFLDWMDWWLPEAWNVEHNKLHHYKLGERADPDLVEDNLSYLRDLRAPTALKRLGVGVIMCIWKWWYYAPNTYKHYQLHSKSREELAKIEGLEQTRYSAAVLTTVLGDRRAWHWYDATGVLLKVLGPYFLYTFVLLPLPWLALGGLYYRHALLNMVLAETLSNVHSFIIIATNHCGDDLYRFDSPCKAYSGDYYLRQVISTANYSAGTDVVDYLHGYLNYQVEHHLFPSLSMLSYRKAMPEVKRICAKHGVPYVQESVWTRLGKTVDIMIGATSMRQYRPSPFNTKNKKLA